VVGKERGRHEHAQRLLNEILPDGESTTRGRFLMKKKKKESSWKSGKSSEGGRLKFERAARDSKKRFSAVLKQEHQEGQGGRFKLWEKKTKGIDESPRSGRGKLGQTKSEGGKGKGNRKRRTIGKLPR